MSQPDFLSLLILYHCLNGCGGTVTRNKRPWIFGPTCSLCLYVGNWAPWLLDSLGPQVAVVDDEILTTIEDMIEAMTDTKIMITGTEEGRPLLTTVATGHDRDPVPIVQDAIDTGVIVPEDFAFSSF